MFGTILYEDKLGISVVFIAEACRGIVMTQKHLKVFVDT
jgi:hypothetical protein